MPEFIVQMRLTQYYEIHLEAENEAHARERAFADDHDMGVPYDAEDIEIVNVFLAPEEKRTPKKLSDITDKEWVMYQWHEVTQFNDKERTFVRLHEHTPEEKANVIRNLHSYRVYFGKEENEES